MPSQCLKFGVDDSLVRVRPSKYVVISKKDSKDFKTREELAKRRNAWKLFIKIHLTQS